MTQQSLAGQSLRISGRRAILAATLAGLALRLAWWWYARPDPVSDFEQLRRVAEGLLDHHQFGYPNLDAGRMPAYPFMLAALMLISRSVAWLSFVTVLLSTLMVPLVATMTRGLGLGERAAVIAAFICAFDPTFVYFAPVLATEHLFGLFLFGTIVILTRASSSSTDRSRFRQCALAGVVAGLAALSRVDTLFYMPLLVTLAWVRAPRPRLAGPVVLVMGVTLVLAPWYLRNRVVMGPGAGLSTTGGLAFYYAHNDVKYGWHPLNGTTLEGLGQLEVQRRGFALGFDYLAHAGVRRIARDILTGTRLLYSPLSSPYSLRWSTRRAGTTIDDFSEKPLAGKRVFEWIAGLYAVVLAGAIVSLRFVRQWPPLAAFVLYGVIVLNWIGHGWLFIGDPRFRYVPEIVFCVLTAAVIDRVMTRVQPPFARHVNASENRAR